MEEIPTQCGFKLKKNKTEKKRKEGKKYPIQIPAGEIKLVKVKGQAGKVILHKLRDDRRSKKKKTLLFPVYSYFHISSCHNIFFNIRLWFICLHNGWDKWHAQFCFKTLWAEDIQKQWTMYLPGHAYSIWQFVALGVGDTGLCELL